ncbi:MAG TPA: serine--tRNA ligase [Candidatus Cloacimonadota bacterium]|jgi:seryl-tRNA synthetase|nr:serine--tRNA ligase [Candidatus Cloacimonadales bacterium]HPY97313.1 serine--tRNA ligase [Candidatus Cloacimonadota bacterium]HQB41800.1 serine--tRNA ligase [Candidatus Cloacimonadota bacterium]
MLDLKFIRENIDLVKQSVKNKNEKADIDALINLDEKKRKAQFEFDNLRAEQNRVSKEIALLKKEKKDASELLSEMQSLATKIKELSSELSDLSASLDTYVLTVPNIPHSSVKIGKNEEENTIIREWGEKREFSFTPKEHTEIAEGLNLLDITRGAKITGSGFPVYTKHGALLERALINFMLDFHIQKHGYCEVMVPHIVNRQTMTGTGQLPKLENDMYHINEDDFFLIPTAEVPVTNLYANEILPLDKIPQKLVAYTPCFRREAGSYGKDTKGLQRLHQFNKVEMVRFVHPDDSWTILEEMCQDAEEILQALKLPYHVLSLCTGDMSFASAKTYDLMVWVPGAQKYLEVSSVSNFTDFQARRANIRLRDADGKVKFVHTLNGSGLATPRTFIAILENYQNEDGSITIPDALLPYMHGMTRI